MRIIHSRLHSLTPDELQAAITGLVWALTDTDSNQEIEIVEMTLWLLESELLGRGILPNRP